MQYYVTNDCMCSTNVAFNMKTVENVLIFFTNFWSLFSLNFFTLCNRMPNTYKHHLRGSDGTEAWLMRKSHTSHCFDV